MEYHAYTYIPRSTHVRTHTPTHIYHLAVSHQYISKSVIHLLDQTGYTYMFRISWA